MYKVAIIGIDWKTPHMIFEFKEYTDDMDIRSLLRSLEARTPGYKFYYEFSGLLDEEPT